MKNRNLYLEAVQNIPDEVKRETRLTFAIADKIASLLHQKNLSQKDLALKMGKSEAEVSVWLSGQHNFTLRTLAKLSSALGTDIVAV
ncbi:MAG: helix-turn-helix transcriptional regulator [Bacteroidaceae bacterium]|nr:helix-turn-helix transcriptional regulator [Bacteroidaceae bacterium]